MPEAKAEKNGWLMYALPLVILTCFAIAYWPVLMKLEHQWSAGDNSYCYLIVPLFLYLCWEKRKGQRGKSKEERENSIDRRSDVRDQPATLPADKKAEGKSFAFGEFSWSAWGLIPVVFSVVLIIIGELGSVRALMFMGIWGCVVGLCVMLYGKRTRHLVFPLLILFFIVPLPPFVNQVLTFKLKMAASKLSVWMLRAVGVSVVLEGNIIDIGVEKLQVVDACSGLRYFMPMILMALLVAYFFVKGRWRWTVLLLLIVPLSVFINAVRIWMSALLTASGHPELAQNLFHDFSGWLMFMIAGCFLVATALILRRIGHPRGIGFAFHRAGRFTQTYTDQERIISHRHTPVPSSGATGQAQKSEVRNQRSGGTKNEKVGKSEGEPATPTADRNVRLSTINYKTLNAEPLNAEPHSGFHRDEQNVPNRHWARPVILTVVLCLLFAGSGWALKQIPSSSNLPQRMSFEHFPMKIGDWHGKREYISQEILNSLWADDYVTARYFKDGSPNMMYLLIPFYNYQATNHTAHAPQACILGGGFSLVRSKEHLVRVSPDRDIKIMTMILEKGDTRLLGSYFFLQKGRVITSPWMNKFYLIWDGITKQRTDGALVRAEMTVAPGQTMEDAYDELEGFIVKLWPILPKYVPN